MGNPASAPGRSNWTADQPPGLGNNSKVPVVPGRKHPAAIAEAKDLRESRVPVKAESGYEESSPRMSPEQRWTRYRRELPFIRARQRIYVVQSGGVARWQQERESKRRKARKEAKAIDSRISTAGDL